MTDELRLPPIDLADLPERTKDYVLALCNATPGMTPKEAIKSVLDNAAADYMPRTPLHRPSGQTKQEVAA